MVRRLRSVPRPSPTGSSSASRDGGDGPPRRNRRQRYTLTLDLLGLHRRKREAIRALHEQVEVLENLVGLLDMLSVDVYADDEGADLRATSTMMKAALKEIAAISVELAARLGELRFMAHLRAITVEEP